MKRSDFVHVLKEANKRAAAESHNPILPDMRGDAVVVIGLSPVCKSVAIKLGAEPVDAGLLFAPAEMPVPNVPLIRSRQAWAHAFQRLLVQSGMKAYVVEYHKAMAES